MTALFGDVIFGPVSSRRFGCSLGVNLIPVSRKICSFDCIYCECGWTDSEQLECEKIIDKESVASMLEQELLRMNADGKLPDAITFSGNGEPTMHPQFYDIIVDTVALRDKYAPNAKITVLSNSTMLGRENVAKALRLIDNNVLKLDAGNDEMMRLINRSKVSIDVDRVVELMIPFRGNLTLQTIFLRGEVDGIKIDNTTDAEVDSWLKRVVEIKPDLVMIYPIQRDTPAKDLVVVEKDKLNEIADKVRALGFKAEVF